MATALTCTNYAQVTWPEQWQASFLAESNIAAICRNRPGTRMSNAATFGMFDSNRSGRAGASRQTRGQAPGVRAEGELDILVRLAARFSGRGATLGNRVDSPLAASVGILR